VGRALRLLDRQRPEAGAEDLRGFEWFYVWQQMHQESRQLTGSMPLVNCIDVSPDNQLLAAGGPANRNLQGGVVHLWEIPSGRLRTTLTDFRLPVSSVQFSSDGNLLATGGAGSLFAGGTNGEVKLWDLASESQVAALPSPPPATSSVMFAQDNTWLIATGGRKYGGTPGQAKIWDLSTEQIKATFEGHERFVTGASLTAAGDRLVTTSQDRTVRCWNLASQACEKTLRQPDNKPISCLSCSHDGNLIATGSQGQIFVWNLDTAQLPFVLDLPEVSINSLDFASDDKSLLVGGQHLDGRAHLGLLPLQKPDESIVFRGHLQGILCASFGADDKMVVSAGRDGTVRVWDLDSVATSELLRTGTVMDVSFSPDGSEIVMSDFEKRVEVSEANAAKSRLTIQCPAIVTAARFSPDQKMIASCDSGKAVRLWDAATGEELATLGTFRKLVKSIAFSPDGKHLIAVGGMLDDELKVWQLPEQKLVAEPSAHSVTINDVAFSPDGRWMATASGDNSVVVWDFARIRPHRRLRVGSNGDVATVAFSPDGQTLAAGGYEGLVKVYDVQTGNLLSVLEGHGQRVLSVVFSPDGKRIVSGGVDKRIVIWDVATYQPLMSLPTSGMVRTIAFSPDGSRIIAGQQDGLWAWRGAAPGDAAISIVERIAAVFEDSPSAALSLDPGAKTRSMSGQNSLLADAVHRARDRGWRAVAVLMPVLEAADRANYPGLHAFLEDIRPLAESYAANRPTGDLPSLDVERLLTRNPNYWRAWSDVAPGDPGLLLLHSSLLLAAGEFDRSIYFAALSTQGSMRQSVRDLFRDLADEIRPVNNAANQLIREGITHHDAERYSNALEKYECVLEVWPACGWANYEAGYSLRSQDRANTEQVESHFAAVRRHAPLRSEAYQGSDRTVISAMMALDRDVLPVWRQVTAKTFSDGELNRLAKGLQEAMIHDLALAAKGLVIARRGKYLEDDRVFLNTSLAKLLPDVPPEELPTMTLGVDERFHSFVAR
jgi:WD40 repeat protein